MIGRSMLDLFAEFKALIAALETAGVDYRRHRAATRE